MGQYNTVHSPMAAVKCTAVEISPSAIFFLASTGDVTSRRLSVTT
jgi:hypothetical protein